ncbi:MAG: dNTP triphosphohydrolase [Muribaculaceae bacterium]|nr:dNTP triphosphohydrolase [Muribaculaceae bacterium]
MKWEQLICDARLGLEDYHDPRRSQRSDFQRDYDRLVFSSPFRRLQNKTQVFPLPGSIFVHNRLTHSMEVACVGRSLATDVATVLRRKYAAEPWVEQLDSIGEIVSAACLAHDLGNPPFGHSGEKAISTFFSEGIGRDLENELTPEQWNDLIHFEGNANSFRVLTHQFNGRRPGGFAMTYATLASIVKYPYESSLAGGKNKFGFFTSERERFTKIADRLGLLPMPAPDGRISYARHPLVYLVEAADDICYEIMDLEDSHKLKILGTQEVIDLMLGYFVGERRAHIEEQMSRVADPNEKIAYLRSCAVGALVSKCTAIFLEHEEEILAGEFTGSLLSHISEPEGSAYRRCSEVSWNKIYCAPDVVDIELAGNQIVTFLLEKLITAVRHPELNYSQLLLSKVPQQYDVNAPTLFGKIQAVLDHVSAMTDVYALDLYRKLNGMSLPAV